MSGHVAFRFSDAEEAARETVEGMSIHSDDALVQDKAARLFRYLAALAELRSKTVRDLASYEAVFWLNALPQEKECYCGGWMGCGTAEDHWIRIDKPETPQAPQPPTECEHWFNEADLRNASTEPKLLAEIPDPKWQSDESDDDAEMTPAPTLRLTDRPAVSECWASYIEKEWRPWRAEHQRCERVKAAYRELFAIYQEQQRRGEQYELVLGIGTLLWMSRRDQKINRPIVTVRVSIQLEATSGQITISATPDGARFSLEQDMLEVSERPPNDAQRSVEEALITLDSPWVREAVTPILKGWLNALPVAADAVYDDTLAAPVGASRFPKMCFAPTLILRRRGGRTMHDALKKIEKQLAAGGGVPPGIRVLCCGDERPGATNGSTSSAPLSHEEILFPLPTNEQQLQIVHRLGGHSGVLVQGPPGTGKSHTIANLICHLLASGKRVLVTSQTPRALRVLRNKIPEAIRPLTVSLLGEDSGSQLSREEAVQSIRATHQVQDLREIDRRIQSKSRERDSLLSDVADLRRQLREIRETETLAIQITGTHYKGTPAAIAKELSRDAGKFEWLTDDVAPETIVPLSDQELMELLQLWEQCQDVPSEADASLPATAELDMASNAYVGAKAGLAKLDGAPGWSTARELSAIERPRLAMLADLSEEFVEILASLDKRAEHWLEGVKQDVLANRASRWTAIEAATRNAIDGLAKSDVDTADDELELTAPVSRAQLLADAIDLYRYLTMRRSLGIWPFRARVVRRCSYLWRKCRFNGRLCDRAEVLDGLIRYLHVRDRLDRAWQEWSDIVPQPSGTVLARLLRLKECHSGMQSILRLGELQSTAERVLGEGLGNPGSALIARAGEQLLSRAPLIALHLLDLRTAEESLSALADRVAQARDAARCHPIFEETAAAVAERNVPRYEAARQVLRQELAMLERRSYLDNRLRTSAPRLAEAIRSTDARKSLANCAGSFGAAWAWKQGGAWLRGFSKTDPCAIFAEVTRKERRLQKVTEELAGNKAWRWCLQRLEGNPSLAAALAAWSQAVAAIGKGTGKQAETYRRDARKYLQQCSPAIPAWIMPLYRVVEQVEAREKAFDVVIVDEASQTGPEGLILQYLADKCVIVGDDKQISPEVGFVDGNEVRTLIEQHLEGIPFCERLTPASSLFDQAEIRYGNRITLREHFRCMPEIIRFSNDLCYSGTPLIPLRQYRSPRLPPIEVRFVRDAYREGKGQRAINRPEAAALAKSIIDCLNDRRYAGKSFGVICLQGHAQAKVIENMLLEAVGPGPFKDKSIRLLCGDPYSFQGDERDIVFLSMVAAIDGESRHAPLTRDSFKQRFNVAVSRARDQVWLFHSVRESELNPACMRRRLISFCSNYHIACGPPADAEYDSDFERDVAEDLGREGYHVIPGFEVAGKRIDLAVGDAQLRLGIECDGDHWHGPDQYEADMTRQRMLERCEWQFIRVRASVFYANRPRAVRELVDAIRSHGLESNSNPAQETVHRDWVREVSGEECLLELQAGASLSGSKSGARQQRFFEDDQKDSHVERADSEDANWAKKLLNGSRDHPSEDEADAALRAKPPAAKSPTSISEDDRTAILSALKKSPQPSGITLISVDADVKKLLLTDQRLKEILRVLVSDELVMQQDTPKGPRYSAR